MSEVETWLFAYVLFMWWYTLPFLFDMSAIEKFQMARMTCMNFMNLCMHVHDRSVLRWLHDCLINWVSGGYDGVRNIGNDARLVCIIMLECTVVVLYECMNVWMTERMNEWMHIFRLLILEHCWVLMHASVYLRASNEHVSGGGLWCRITFLLRFLSDFVFVPKSEKVPALHKEWRINKIGLRNNIIRNKEWETVPGLSLVGTQ